MSFEGPGVHLKLQVAIWSSRWAFGAPGGRLELQLAFGAPGGHLEFQLVIWNSRWSFGVPGGRLELKGAI